MIQYSFKAGEKIPQFGCKKSNNGIKTNNAIKTNKPNNVTSTN